MVCFEVTINGKKVCIAGAGERGVLDAIMTWVKREVTPEEQKKGREEDVEFIFLRVGGLIHPEEQYDQPVCWLDQSLSVGDEITITTLESDHCDKPIETERAIKMECSFCKKQQSDVSELIAGTQAYICDECVLVARNMLAESVQSDNQTFAYEHNEEVRCCFCGKQRSEVTVLLKSSDDFYICDECVTVSEEVIQEAEKLRE